jgi:hypothetical protein
VILDNGHGNSRNETKPQVINQTDKKLLHLNLNCGEPAVIGGDQAAPLNTESTLAFI